MGQTLQTDKRAGTVYVYETKSCWDKDKKTGPLYPSETRRAYR